MITATGNMRFTTSTDAAALLRTLIDLVDDLQFSGIAVEVSVRIGDSPPVGNGQDIITDAVTGDLTSDRGSRLCSTQ